MKTFYNNQNVKGKTLECTVGPIDIILTRLNRETAKGTQFL